MAPQAQGKRTIEHDEIRAWAQERGGRPAVLADSRADGSGILRIDFGEKEELLEPVSWEEFFRMFEENDFAFIGEISTPEGEHAYGYKFVARGPEDEMDFLDPNAGETSLLDEETL